MNNKFLYVDPEALVQTIEGATIPSINTVLILDHSNTGMDLVVAEIIPNDNVNTGGRIAAVKLDNKYYLTTDSRVFICGNDNTYKLKDKFYVLAQDKIKLIPVRFNPYINPVLLLSETSYRIYTSIESLPEDAKYNETLRAYVTKPIREVNIPDLMYFTRPEKIHKYNEIIREAAVISSKLTTTQEYPEAQILKDLSFGIEQEVCDGSPPFLQLAAVGLFAAFDGSIEGRNGTEYISIPYKGNVGIETFKKAYALMKEHCKINMSCGLHVTFGNLPKDKAFLVALYLLYYRVQYDIVGFLPAYMVDPVSIGDKGQNYAQPIPNMLYDSVTITEPEVTKITDLVYSRIEKFFVAESEENNTVWEHKTWYCAGRYVALNLVKYFNVEAGEPLIEFRGHHPTLNVDKALNWVLICTSIINYARENTEAIIMSPFRRTKFTLYDVLESIEISSIRKKLLEYVTFYTQYRHQQYGRALVISNQSRSGLRMAHATLKTFNKRELKVDTYWPENSEEESLSITIIPNILSYANNEYRYEEEE